MPTSKSLFFLAVPEQEVFSAVEIFFLLCRANVRDWWVKGLSVQFEELGFGCLGQRIEPPQNLSSRFYLVEVCPQSDFGIYPVQVFLWNCPNLRFDCSCFWLHLTWPNCLPQLIFHIFLYLKQLKRKKQEIILWICTFTRSEQNKTIGLFLLL